MTLTKADLMDSIHTQLDLPRHECTQLIESLLEIIKEDLILAMSVGDVNRLATIRTP